MVHFYGRFSFFSGLILGVILALLLKKFGTENSWKSSKFVKKSYEKWFDRQGLKRHHDALYTLQSTNKEFILESQFLFNKIRVLCVIISENETSLNISLATWAKGCNYVKSIILQNNKKPLPAIKIVRKNARWSILCNLLNEVELYKTEWVLIANKYTYAILENFRYYVAPLDPMTPYYLGYAVKFWNTIYNTKASAYALNTIALRGFQQLTKSTGCFAENAYLNKEDFFLGKTLASLNITPTDTRDEEGFSLFYPKTWDQVHFPENSNFQFSLYPITCCSKMSIAFQTNNNDKMYTINYLLYTLKVVSNMDISTHELQQPRPASDDDLVWRNFLKSQNLTSENISDKQYFRIWEELVSAPNSPWQIPTEEYSSDRDKK